MTDEKLTADQAASADAPVSEKKTAAEPDMPDVIFTGGSSHGIDTKGRIIVPNDYREGLGETFFVGPTQDFKGVALYPNKKWLEMRTWLAKLSQYDQKLRKYLTQFDAMSFAGQSCDNQGRLLLPARLRQRIFGDNKDMEVSGAFDHVVIMTRNMSEDEYEEVVSNTDCYNSTIDELSRKLANIDR